MTDATPLVRDPRPGDRADILEAADSAPTPRFPLRGQDVGAFAAWFAGLTALFTVIGWIVTNISPVTDFDQQLAEDLAANRTDRMNDLTFWGSMMSDTMVKIVGTAVLAIALRLALKRWREPLILVVPLVLEAAIFITTTTIVGRPRPDVERLEGSPVNSSFPSGHVAAATVYLALVVIAFLVSRRAVVRMTVLTVVIGVIVAVAYSRMYRGMHNFTDVVFGVLLGLISLWAGWKIVDRAARRSDPASAAVMDRSPSRLPAPTVDGVR